jgi:hypothetical protein
MFQKQHTIPDTGTNPAYPSARSLRSHEGKESVSFATSPSRPLGQFWSAKVVSHDSILLPTTQEAYSANLNDPCALKLRL